MSTKLYKSSNTGDWQEGRKGKETKKGNIMFQILIQLGLQDTYFTSV